MGVGHTCEVLPLPQDKTFCRTVEFFCRQLLESIKISCDLFFHPYPFFSLQTASDQNKREYTTPIFGALRATRLVASGPMERRSQRRQWTERRTQQNVREGHPHTQLRDKKFACEKPVKRFLSFPFCFRFRSPHLARARCEKSRATSPKLEASRGAGGHTPCVDKSESLAPDGARRISRVCRSEPGSTKKGAGVGSQRGLGRWRWALPNRAKPAGNSAGETRPLRR